MPTTVIQKQATNVTRASVRASILAKGFADAVSPPPKPPTSDTKKRFPNDLTLTVSPSGLRITSYERHCTKEISLPWSSYAGPDVSHSFGCSSRQLNDILFLESGDRQAQATSAKDDAFEFLFYENGQGFVFKSGSWRLEIPCACRLPACPLLDDRLNWKRLTMEDVLTLRTSLEVGSLATTTQDDNFVALDEVGMVAYEGVSGSVVAFELSHAIETRIDKRGAKELAKFLRRNGGTSFSTGADLRVASNDLAIQIPDIGLGPKLDQLRTVLSESVSRWKASAVELDRILSLACTTKAKITSRERVLVTIDLNETGALVFRVLEANGRFGQTMTLEPTTAGANSFPDMNLNAVFDAERLRRVVRGFSPDFPIEITVIESNLCLTGRYESIQVTQIVVPTIDQPVTADRFDRWPH